MTKTDVLYLAHRLFSIACFTIGLNVVMMKSFTHFYLVAVGLFAAGILILFRVPQMHNRVSRCLKDRHSLAVFAFEMLFFVGYAAFVLALFHSLFAQELQIKALVLSFALTLFGGFFYFRRCYPTKNEPMHS